VNVNEDLINSSNCVNADSSWQQQLY